MEERASVWKLSSRMRKINCILTYEIAFVFAFKWKCCMNSTEQLTNNSTYIESTTIWEYSIVTFIWRFRNKRNDDRINDNNYYVYIWCVCINEGNSWIVIRHLKTTINLRNTINLLCAEFWILIHFSTERKRLKKRYHCVCEKMQWRTGSFQCCFSFISSIWMCSYWIIFEYGR